MNYQIAQIAERLRGLRDALDLEFPLKITRSGKAEFLTYR
jgi:hypothetical protein